MQQQRTSSNTKNFKIFFSKRVGAGGLVIDLVKGLRSTWHGGGLYDQKRRVIEAGFCR
jgi:hypothetical protein